MSNNYNEIIVSVVIPCRNEVNFIDSCIKSIINNGFPKDKLEVLIVDGMSDDETRIFISKYINKYSFIKLLDNYNGDTPKALNIGIRASTGNYIIILSSHSTIDTDFIQKSVCNISKYNADCVGGVMLTRAGKKNKMAVAISLALSSPFGVGNSYFRIGVAKPQSVDTVPFGCYKREVFNKYGLFNENLSRNQDIEFNKRIKSSGGRIILCPDIISFYYARSRLRDLLEQNYLNGLWVIFSIKYANLAFSFRHLVPMFFVLILLVGIFLPFVFSLHSNFLWIFYLVLVLYLSANLFYAFTLSLKNSLKVYPLLCIIFPSLHFSYGLGSIIGGFKIIRHILYSLIFPAKN